MSKHTPDNVKQDFYFKFSNTNNYKDLTIKKNSITTNLKEIFNKNIWNLKTLAEQLEHKQIIEHNNFYNAFLSDVYILDFKKQPKLNTITIKDFYNYKFQDGKTTRNELNYINTFKSWINNIFIDHKKDLNFNYFVLNQNEALFKLIEYRNLKNNSLESLRKDFNLLLKILKLVVGERAEIVNKYKVININLSKICEYSQKTNTLTPLEATKFINYDDLLKIRQDLYNDWETDFENTGLNKYKNNKLRIKNIKSLLLSFYLLFPPLRLEGFKLKVIKTEKEYINNEASIFIKDKNNIIVYLNEKKKGHKPIIYNLNDDVIKSFSKKHVNTLINNIIESLTEYPRESLFINSSNKQYTEDGLKKLLKEITKEKNIGVNALRSAYVSHYFNKLNKLQLERIAFLMRSSVGTLQNHYLKNDGVGDEPEPDEPTPAPKDQIINQVIKKQADTKPLMKVEEVEIKHKVFTNEEHQQYRNNKNAYLKQYYNEHKNDLLARANEHSKTNYGQRLARELNKNMISFEKMRPITIEKWGIKYDVKTKKYTATN